MGENNNSRSRTLAIKKNNYPFINDIKMKNNKKLVLFLHFKIPYLYQLLL